jgi:hypothetical protein
MSHSPPSVPEGPAADAGSAGRGFFRQEGDFWTVGYGERVFRLKDCLGLSFISYLLRHPGAEFHVVDCWFAARTPKSLSGSSGRSGRNSHPSSPNATNRLLIAKCTR